MKEKVKIYQAVFDILHKSVQARFYEIALSMGQRPEGRGAEYYGFGKFKDSEKITLMESLLSPKLKPENQPSTNKDLYQYLKGEGRSYRQMSRKHLYNLSRLSAKMQDEYDILEIDLVVLNVLSKYLKYKDFLSFIKEHSSINDRLADFQRRLIDKPEDELSENELASQYLGFYWSFITGGRKHIRLWINYYNKVKGNYPAKVMGLNGGEDEGLDGMLYKGSAQDASSSSYFYINLQEDHTERPLVLMGYKGHVPLKDMKYISCTASGIAKFGYPFSMELMLLKLDDDQKEKRDDEIINDLNGKEHIDFYLQFQRRNFRIPPRIFTKLDTISARSNRSAQFQHLIGTYRMWSLGYTGKIIQYKFIIHPDFTSNLYTPEKNEIYAEQRCVLSINSLKNKLCVSSHTKYGVSVINYAILDIDLGSRNRIRNGAYCGIGLAREAKIVGEYLLYFKDDSEFETGKLVAEDIVRMIKENPFLKEPFEHLLSSNRINKRRNFLESTERLKANIEAKI